MRDVWRPSFSPLDIFQHIRVQYQSCLLASELHTAWTMRALLLQIVLWLCCIENLGAFSPATTSSSSRAVQRNAHTTTLLKMAPRFDAETQRWSPTTLEEEADAGYPPTGSLIRQGPIPFFVRLFKSDEYEQSVLKYMATENCTRMEAQGNIDCFWRNQNDWMERKMIEQRTGKKFDFASPPSTQKIVLTAVWACIVVYFFSDLAYKIGSGRVF